MKRWSVVMLALFVAPIATADVVEVDGTGITFEAPDEFVPLSQEYIDIKWPSRNAPRFAVGNERATTTIAFDIKPRDIANADMTELLAAFEQVFDRVIPGIRWIAKDIIERDGQQWLYLEMTSNAIDTDIHNIMLITAFGNEMLLLNFNSTREDFPKYEQALRVSIDSIRLP